jgi:hypothetical protein
MSVNILSRPFVRKTGFFAPDACALSVSLPASAQGSLSPTDRVSCAVSLAKLSEQTGDIAPAAIGPSGGFEPSATRQSGGSSHIIGDRCCSVNTISLSHSNSINSTSHFSGANWSDSARTMSRSEGSVRNSNHVSVSNSISASWFFQSDGPASQIVQ